MRTWQGRSLLAAELGRRALDAARSAGLGSEARRCLELICRCYLMGPIPATQALQELEELGRAPEVNRAVRALIDVMRSYQMLCTGRQDHATAIRDRVEHELREVGQLLDPADLLNLDRNIATEDWTAAAARDREIIEMFEARGRWGNVGTHTANLAATLAESGDEAVVGEASVLIEEAKRLTLPWDRLNLILIAQVGASLAARGGGFDEAERLAHEAIDLASSSDWIDIQGQTWSALAEVFFAADRPLDAEEAAHEAIERYERRGNVESAARTRRFLGRSDVTR